MPTITDDCFPSTWLVAAQSELVLDDGNVFRWTHVNEANVVAVSSSALSESVSESRLACAVDAFDDD